MKVTNLNCILHEICANVPMKNVSSEQIAIIVVCAGLRLIY